LPKAPATTSLERSPSLETSPMPAPVTLPSTPPSLAQPDTPAEQQAGEAPLRPPAPPPLPPWSDAFSTDPDRIICCKCCRRSYVFRWYSHCFMCHLDETRT
jgi:hypothetical protein